MVSKSLMMPLAAVLMAIVVMSVVVYVLRDVPSDDVIHFSGNVVMTSGQRIDPTTDDNVSWQGFELHTSGSYQCIVSHDRGDWVEFNFTGRHLEIDVVFNTEPSQLTVELLSGGAVVHEETLDVPANSAFGASSHWDVDYGEHGEYKARITNSGDTPLYIDEFYVDAEFTIVN